VGLAEVAGADDVRLVDARQLGTTQPLDSALGGGDHRLRASIGEEEGDLGSLVEDVHRNRHSAGLDDAVERNRELLHVGQLQPDRVPRVDALRDEVRSHDVGGPVELGVGESSLVGDDRRLPGVRSRGLLEDDGDVEGHVLGLPLVRLVGWSFRRGRT
jgi:hypothetical protein